MTSGLYALASLDGAPLGNVDRALLGLDGESTRDLHCVPGLVVRAVDPLSAAVSFASLPNGLIVLAGYLDEQEELRARLGLGLAANPAELAWAAVERWKDAATRALLGEWSLLHWDQRACRLTLLLSEATRDPLYWATDGRYIAVAPDMLRLCSLPWVGRAFDPEGVAMHLGRAAIRGVMGKTTLWQGVSRVAPAVREVFAPGERKTIKPAPPDPPELWRGSFDDAVEALHHLGGRIVGQQLGRYGRVAFLLSGGLDSSLLTTLASSQPGADMFCLCSVAPEGSGLPDERAYSAAVAEQAGVDLRFVCPLPTASAYRPAEALFALRQVPMVNPRHYLEGALWTAAHAAGADAVMDGAGGELSITRKPPPGTGLWWPRRKRVQLLDWWDRRRDDGGWPQAGFHMRLSDEFLQSLPRAWKHVWREGPARPGKQSPSQATGVHPAVQKIATQQTSAPTIHRHLVPFRDRRLLNLAATFPVEFFAHGGETRPLARAMLRDKVPEAVRLRTRGLPFSPDYDQRLATQANDARARIPVFREAGVDRWLDLGWLSAALLRVEDGSAAGGTQFQAQLTSCAAEFFTWVQSKGALPR